MQILELNEIAILLLIFSFSNKYLEKIILRNSVVLFKEAITFLELLHTLRENLSKFFNIFERYL